MKVAVDVVMAVDRIGAARRPWPYDDFRAREG